MPTFIDESGDTGWRPGAQPFFRMAAVWLPNFEVVEACRETIREVRIHLSMKAHDEFKFAKTGRHLKRRESFFKAVLAHEFRFAACAYDKRRMANESLLPQGFHWGCAVALATQLKAVYLQAEDDKAKSQRKPMSLNELVVVDDNQDRGFLAEVKRAFAGLQSGQKRGAKLVSKVKFRGSEPDELLQLVDMVVGAVGAHLDGDDTWFKLIADRSLGVVCLPTGTEPV